jgi:cell division transport system permease protein
VYALREAFRQVLRHPTASLATFFTALVSFALLYFLGLLLWNLEKVVQSLERELEVAAFLQRNANVEALLTEIQAWPEVGEVRLVTKEEALAQLVLDYPYLAEAKDLVENPLPDTLRLRLKTPEAVRAVAQRLKALPGVEGVEYGGELTERLVQVLSGSRLAMALLVGLLLLNTFFSVMGAIRLSVESRKEALAIMLLVGATRRFIQPPSSWKGSSSPWAPGCFRCWREEGFTWAWPGPSRGSSPSCPCWARRTSPAPPSWSSCWPLSWGQAGPTWPAGPT